MKKLVIVSHPDIDASRANSRWLKEAKTLERELTVHQLYEAYPSEKLNVKAEQELLLEHSAVILQFPLYWFSTPPLLKKWLDEVLLPGFAYGRNESDRKLAGKRFGLAISAGIKEADYRQEGRYRHTVEEFLAPLIATINYIKAVYVPPYVLYGVEYDPTNPDLEDMSDEIEDSAASYVKYLRSV